MGEIIREWERKNMRDRIRDNESEKTIRECVRERKTKENITGREGVCVCVRERERGRKKRDRELYKKADTDRERDRDRGINRIQW